MTRAAFALALAVALLGPAAAPAAADFRINRSMEGVELGTGRAEVRERLGRPAGGPRSRP